MDRIIIKELGLNCNIGVNVEEKKKKQPIFVDVEMFLDLREAGEKDDIEKTINYSTVCKEIIKLSEKEYNTIESLAENIAKQIKKNFKIERIKICVIKPKALEKKGAKYAAVEIER